MGKKLDLNKVKGYRDGKIDKNFLCGRAEHLFRPQKQELTTEASITPDVKLMVTLSHLNASVWDVVRNLHVNNKLRKQIMEVYDQLP